MTRTVNCIKLGREAPGLEQPPFDNELGQKIYDQVSQEAWEFCKQQLTMVINEYQLTLANPEVQQRMMQQIEDFFFGEGIQSPPPDYVPPSSK